jgi:dienelactone hydrolase
VREQVRFRAGQVELDGELQLPAAASGLVIFAHGSGSSRHSPRNRYVADALYQRGLGTLLFDLLTADEDRDPALRFDIPLLARRLDAAVAWARASPLTREFAVGLFGASTGAAAALIVAGGRPQEIAAVVSRGGRPDLAGAKPLSLVRSHVLLIVGGADLQVLQLNREAAAAMHDRAQLVQVPGATHLFEERGALEQVAALAGDWFAAWL